MDSAEPGPPPTWRVFSVIWRVVRDLPCRPPESVHHRGKFSSSEDGSPEVAAMVSGYRTTCFVDGCDRVPAARGYCRGHYTQIYRHGRVTGLLRPRSVKAPA